jgi:hypothetical protein
VALYGMADRTSNVTTAAANFEIRTTSTDRAFIKQIKVTLVTAAATVLGIGRPAAIGVTPTSPKTVLPYDSAGPAGTATTAVAWGTGPTVPANYFERVSFPATIGAGFVWEFREPGLMIPVSSSLIIWNILGGATLDVSVLLDE